MLSTLKHEAHAARQELDKVSVPGSGGLGLASMAKRVFQEQSDDRVGGWAASLAYHALFAIFPFMTLLLSLLAVVDATSLVDALLSKTGTVLPPDAQRLLKSQILTIAQSNAQGAFTIGAIVSLIAALWGISGGFRAVMQATNVMYSVNDGRPIWKQYVVSLVLSVVAIALLITALVLLVFGPKIGGWVAGLVGAGALFAVAWNILQWFVVLLGVLLAFSIVERYAPAVDLPFRLISPGSILTLGAWLLFSWLFSLYVSHFGSFNATYGSFAGFAIFLLYIYYSAYILLLGTEVNHVILEHKQGPRVHGEEQRQSQGSQRKTGT